MRLRYQVQMLDRKIQLLHEKKRLAWIKGQKSCKHPEIVECSYLPETPLFDAQPPIRVCVTCGLAEEEWGSGPWLLSSDQVKQVCREEALKLVLGPIIEQCDMEGMGRYGAERGLKWCVRHDRGELVERSPIYTETQKRDFLRMRKS
jgi:hypothetical protein